MPFTLSSPAFAAGRDIPVDYTCEAGDVSPPLDWSDPPPGTESFALIVDDPDAPDPAAPKRTWVHWVVYNLPAGTARLAEAADRDDLPDGARTGTNDWGNVRYGGPAPPVGRHRYFFKLFALDRELPDLGRPTKADLLRAMDGHVLGTAELVGRYQKSRTDDPEPAAV
ncbi:MAG: YbhB/YbcL family Raf kinase inhibitor-like protein [Isosphaera sp.]|nr:YbhB/YbcL family Raf kinase inhibitor-like protein [Isosphaera sp.]